MENAKNETWAIISEIPGGKELLDWTGLIDADESIFGDSEIISLHLNRSSTSTMKMLILKRSGGGWLNAEITLYMKDLIDVSIEGFAHQNVIGGLEIKRATSDNRHLSLLGIGSNEADHMILLEPCAGAFGFIRASIFKIDLKEL